MDDFQLFALDEPTRLPDNPNRRELIGAMAGHVLAAGELVGIYERN